MSNNASNSERNVATTPSYKLTYAGEPSEMEKLQNEANVDEREGREKSDLMRMVSDNRRWKSVDEASPEEESIVDIYVKFPNSGHDGGLRITDVLYKDGKFRRDTTDQYRHVTHWKPLPEPPE